MADTAIHENGMSIMLCDLCNRYPDFREKFCRKFEHFPKEINSDNIKEIDYMYFSGNQETGFGKPDITIRFTDGDFYFIEVKTKHGTNLQSNQENGTYEDPVNKIHRQGYVGLIEYLGQTKIIEQSYGFLVDEGHPGFVGKRKGIGELHDDGSYEFNVDVITWVDVKDAINSCKVAIQNNVSRLSLFLDDIDKNVDNCGNNTNNRTCKFEKIELISSVSSYNEQLKQFNKLKKIKIKLNEEIPLSRNNRKDMFHLISQQVPTINFPILGWYFDLEKDIVKTNSDENDYIEYKEKIWIGFDPYLFDNENIVDSYCYPKQIEKEDFLFCIGISGDLLSKQKVTAKKSNEKYCLDASYWYYFPLLDQTSITELASESLNDIIIKKVTDIFNNYIPNDTNRIKIKLLEKKRVKNG